MEEEKVECFPVLFTKIRKVLQRRHMEILKPFGLGSVHAMYLTILLHEKNGLTSKQLNEQLFVDKANTSRVLNALEEKGYVTRRSVNGLNKNCFVLTESGLEVARIVAADVQYAHDKLIGSLTEEEIRTVKEVLYKISNAANDI